MTMRDNYVLIAGIVASVSFSSFKTRCKCSVCRAKCTVYVAFFPRCAGTKVGYVNACLSIHRLPPWRYLAKSVIYFFLFFSPSPSFLFFFLFFFLRLSSWQVDRIGGNDNAIGFTIRIVSPRHTSPRFDEQNRERHYVVIFSFNKATRAFVMENVRRAWKIFFFFLFCYFCYFLFISVKTRRGERSIKIRSYCIRAR